MQGFRAVDRLVTNVGAERVLFGTGLPLHYPACNVVKIDKATISENDRTLIMHKNALRLLGLGEGETR
jgi:predicted TIM-barrel fold metal-dependent hydrolase